MKQFYGQTLLFPGLAHFSVRGYKFKKRIGNDSIPSSIDNHQLLNAMYIEGLGMGLMHNEFESNELLSKNLNILLRIRFICNGRR